MMASQRQRLQYKRFSVISGGYMQKCMWIPVMGEQLLEVEEENEYDHQAVAMTKDDCNIIWGSSLTFYQSICEM